MVFLSRRRKELRTGVWSLRNKESRKPGREIGIALALSIGRGKRRVLGTGVAWPRPGRTARQASRNSCLRSWLPGFLISHANCSSEAANGNVASRGTSVVIVDRANVVESRCGAVVLGLAYLFPALSVAGASLASPCSVSTSRSSNRAGGFPAPGFRTRLYSYAASHVRPRTVAATFVGAGIIPASGADVGHGTVSFHDPAP